MIRTSLLRTTIVAVMFCLANPLVFRYLERRFPTLDIIDYLIILAILVWLLVVLVPTIAPKPSGRQQGSGPQSQ